MSSRLPDPQDPRRLYLVAAFGLVALAFCAAPTMLGLAPPEPGVGKVFENVALMAVAFLMGRSST